MGRRGGRPRPGVNPGGRLEGLATAPRAPTREEMGPPSFPCAGLVALVNSCDRCYAQRQCAPPARYFLYWYRQGGDCGFSAKSRELPRAGAPGH